jgi:hypothetical protein
MESMDDGAGAEEEKRLERGMGEEVEDAPAEIADSLGRKHVAELRTGRIGDHAFDVRLH